MILAQPGIASAERKLHGGACKISHDETKGNLANLDTMAHRTRTMKNAAVAGNVTDSFGVRRCLQCLTRDKPPDLGSRPAGEPCGEGVGAGVI